jgi:flagellar biosynthesis chaperone FliJ
VFKPFLYVLDDLVFTYFSDAEIFTILGQEMGKDFEVNLQDFHDGVHEFETLAGSSLAAKRTMSQSISLITQIFENPTIQQNLAEINEEYIDFKPILKMWMESSEWKNVQDIIKPLTASMKQKQQQNSQAAQQQSKASTTAQSNDQKFKQKQQLEDQATNNRIKRDVVLSAFKGEDLGQADNGVPSITGLGGQQPLVQ